MASIINSDTTNGIILTPDTSGEIALQSAGVTQAKITSSGLQNASGVAITPQPGRNLIINGNMAIDQRNAGVSKTLTVDSTYTIDRWMCEISQASKFSVQQNAGAVTPPPGFANYLGVTSLTSYSVGTGDYFTVMQRVEGLNAADLDFGKATAKSVTISFWVYSSLTGTFGGSVGNSAENRSYPFEYTISSANTWEQKSITIPGDTTGTWLVTNGRGVNVRFSLGMGSTFTDTASAWTVKANVYSATGATSVVGTSGATFYITGVQLETGTVATEFEHLQYGQQLALCQRYYEVATVPTSTSLFVSYNYAAGAQRFNYWQLKQTKRAAPTIALGASASFVGATATSFSGVDAIQFYHPTTEFYISGTAGVVGITASSEL